MSRLQSVIGSKKCLAAAVPFPSISWWKLALENGIVYLDKNEPFQKMSYRNRYYLAGKQGKMLLSIPLSKGRDQQLPMKAVQISYAEDWQKNHWKTVQSLLGNAPFFEFLDFQIHPFFEKKVNNLYEWNKATIEWANDFLGCPLEIKELEVGTELDDVLDLREIIHPKSNEQAKDISYYQVFATDIGFINDCSILDLICCEGKNALNILKGI